MESTSPATRRRRIVPLVLVAAMLAVVFFAAFSPNVGTVSADSSCVYTDCSTSNSTPLWAWAAIGLVVLAAVILSILLLMRGRRRRPPARPYAGLADDAGAAGAGSAVGSYDEPEPEMGPPAGAVSEDSIAPPAYVEGPEDVSAAAPVLPSQPRVRTATGAGAAGAAGAAAGGDETNIDALMDELDKISGEILKKDQRSKTPPGGGSDGNQGGSG